MPESNVPQLISIYNQHPQFFTNDQVDELEKAAKDSGLPFERNAQGADIDLIRTVTKLGQGFFTGFTTIEVGDAPHNTTEKIAQNIGHLLGFVGYIPGLGSVAKLGTMGTVTAARYIARGLEVARYADEAATALKWGAKAGEGAVYLKSLPMLGADFAKAGLEKMVEGNAMLGASKWFRNGALGREMVEGAFHMGVASAISAAPSVPFVWQSAVDERMKAFWGGAQFGLFQGLLGATVTRGGLVDAGKFWGDGSLEATKRANAVVRSISGAVMLGLPSTLRHDPLEIQVYEYLLNGWFGYNEMAPHEKEAERFLRPYATEQLATYRLMDTKGLPGFDKLSPRAQEEVQYQSDLLWGKYHDTQITLAKSIMGALEDQVALGKMTKDEAAHLLTAQTMVTGIEEEQAQMEKAGMTPTDARAKAEMSLREQVAQEASVLQERIRAQRANPLPSEGIAKDVEASLQNIELAEYAESKGVSFPIAGTLADAARAEHERLGAESPGTTAIHKKMLDVVAEGGMKDYTSFEGRFKKEFPDVAFSAGTEQKLRYLWNLSRYGRVTGKLDYNVDTDTLDRAKELDNLGRSTEEIKILSPLDTMTGFRVWELSTISGKENGKPYIREIQSEDSTANLAKVIRHAMDQGLILVGGQKDNSKLLFTEAIVREVPEQEGIYESILRPGATFKLSDKLKEMGKAVEETPSYAKKGITQKLEDVFLQNLERFAHPVNGTATVDPLTTRLYNLGVANNIALWEHLNGGLKAEDMLREPKRFLNSATKLNKRFQLIHSSDVPMDKELAAGIRDAAQEKFKGILAQIDKSDSSVYTRMSEWNEGLKAWQDRVAETDIDGVMAVRSDVFDILAKSVGAQAPTGSQKGTIVFSDGTHGLFLGKLAFHRAAPELEAHMQKNSLHFVIYDTAAKQHGNWPLHTEVWDKDAKEVQYKDASGKTLDLTAPQAQDPFTYIPFDAIRLNPTTMETGELHNVHIVKQLMEHLDAKGAESFDRLFMRPVVEGSAKGKEQYRELNTLYADRSAGPLGVAQEKRLRDLEKEIRVQDLPLQAILDIVAGDRVIDSPLYRKVLKEVLGRPLPDAEAMDVEQRLLMKRLMKAKSAADAILENAEWTPAVMAKQQVRDFFRMRLLFYLRDRLIRPEVEGSHKGVIYNYDPYMINKYKLQPGEYMAADGLKELEVPVQEGTLKAYVKADRVTLGSLWELYQKKAAEQPQGELARDLEAHLKHVLVRVPADSPSGVRVLTFKGFTGGLGTGFVLHAEDMVNMGGADKDIDSAFLYTGFSKDIKESFDRPEVRDQWYEFRLDARKVRNLLKPEDAQRFLDDYYGKGLDRWVSGPNFHRSTPEEMKPFYSKRLIDPKAMQPFLDRTRPVEDIQRADHPVSMFDPLTMAEVNRDVVRGNQLLGVMLANAKRWRAVQEWARSVNPDTTDLTRELSGKISRKAAKWYREHLGLDLPVGMRWMLTPVDESGRTLDVLAREGVNGAADAADGHRTVSRREALKRIADGAFRLTYLGRDGRPLTSDLTDQFPGLRHYVPKPKVFKALQETDTLLRGMDEQGRIYHVYDWIEGLKDNEDYVFEQQRPSYRAANYLAELKASRDPFNFVGESSLQKAIRMVADIYGSKDALAQSVQSITFRERLAFAKDPYKYRNSVFYNFLTYTDADGKIQRAPRSEAEKRDIDTDFMVNDLEDVASQMLAHKAAEAALVAEAKRRGVDTLSEDEIKEVAEKIREVKRQVDSLRIDHVTVKRQQAEAKQKGEKVLPAAEALKENKKKAAEFWKTLDPSMRFVAEVHALSTLRSQFQESRDEVREHNAAIRELQAQLSNVKDDVEKARIREQLDKWEAAKRTALKKWWETGGTSFPYVQDYISGTTIAAHLKQYSDVAAISFKADLTEEDMRKLTDMGRVERSAKTVKEVLPEADEMNLAPKVKEFTLDFMSKVEELSKQQLQSLPKTQARLKKLESDLRSLLNNTPSLLKNFELAFEGTLMQNRWASPGIAPHIASLRDLEDFLEAFRYRGKWWYELAQDPRKLALVRKHFFLFPEAIAKDHLPFDPNLITLREQPVLTAEGPERRPVAFFLSHMGQLSKFAEVLGSNLDAQFSRIDEASSVRDRLVAQLNAKGEALGTRLYRIAVANHEYGNFAKNPEVLKVYDEHYREAQEDLKRIGRDTAIILRDEKGKEYTRNASEVVGDLVKAIRTWTRESRRLLINEEAEKAFIKTRTHENGYEEVDVQGTLKVFNQWALEGRDLPSIGLNGIYRIIHQIGLEKHTVQLADEYAGGFDYVPLGSLSFEERATQVMKGREAFGDAWMAYRSLEDTLKSPDTYFPHLGHPSKAVNSYLREKLTRLLKTDVLPGQMEKEQIETQLRYGRLLLDDQGAGELAQRVLESEALGKLKETREFNVRPGHLGGRDEDEMGPIPEWDMTPGALVTYERQMTKAYYNMLYSVLSHQVQRDFRRKNVMGEHTESWMKFLKMYSRQVLGLPTIFPQEWMQDKEFHRPMNPYFAFTDDKFVKLYRTFTSRYDLDAEPIVRALREKKEAALSEAAWEKTIKPQTLGNMTEGERLRAYTAWKERELGNVGKMEKLLAERFDTRTDELVTRKVALLSNLEAKWEMLTLLTHTKTMVNNLIGGHVNTVVSAGFEPWRRAGNINHLRDLLGDWVTGKDALQKFVEEYGGVESYIKSELQFGERFSSKNLALALNDAAAEIKANKGFRDTDLWAIGKRYGIQKAVMEKAAWFMRSTERQLRGRSWMAHYLQARKVLSANGYTFEPNDPWLVRMANKGVSASQFIYSNATRPAFAATSMGKVYSRFSLYMWNSVHFRMEIAREAVAHGFRNGIETERFKRMMTADIFIMALASVFPAGMFKQAVAQPWAMLTDMASFVFGNQEERDRAFGGTAPYPANLLGPITPPIGRYVVPVLSNLVTGDWDKFAEYTAWTYFPYGRMVHDAQATLQKPSKILENMAGFPFNHIAQEVGRKHSEERRKKRRLLLMSVL